MDVRGGKTTPGLGECVMGVHLCLSPRGLGKARENRLNKYQEQTAFQTDRVTAGAKPIVQVHCCCKVLKKVPLCQVGRFSDR